MFAQNIIKRLRQEYNALKVAFQTAGSRLALSTRTLSFSTSRNSVTENGFTYDDLERVVVTFEATSSANTLAKLELSGDYETLPIVRRVPYSGGARWVITTNSRVDSSFNWATTTYRFTVHSLAPGTLSAKMIWEA